MADYQINTTVTKIKIYRCRLSHHKVLTINKFHPLPQKPNGKSKIDHYKSIIYPIIYPIIYLTI